MHYVPRDEMAVHYRDYLDRWREAGHPKPPLINYWILVYVDETDDKAWEIAGPSWVYTYQRSLRSTTSSSRAFVAAS